MKLAQRLSAIAPSATLAMSTRAKALQAQGIDVLVMSAGEPDFPPAAHVSAAAQQSITRGESKYTPVAGTPSLRRAVAEHLGRSYQQNIKAEEVIVSAGAKQVLFNACCALLNPGDEAIVLAPYWVSYPDMIRFAGGTPVVVTADESTSFIPPIEKLAAAFTSKTRLLIINSPANPTGAVFSRSELEEIANLLKSHPNVIAITDDIYSSMVYDATFVSLMHVAPNLKERVLIVHGLSKNHALTGWRVGFGAGPKPLIDAMETIQGVSTSGANSVAQAAAVAALTGSNDFVERGTHLFVARRNRICEKLARIPGLSFFKPQGAFYVFPRIDNFFNKTIRSSQQMCEHLLSSVHLAAVPGDAFGSDAHIRLSFACSEQDIDRGVERLHQGLLALRG